MLMFSVLWLTFKSEAMTSWNTLQMMMIQNPTNIQRRLVQRTSPSLLCNRSQPRKLRLLNISDTNSATESSSIFSSVPKETNRSKRLRQPRSLSQSLNTKKPKVEQDFKSSSTMSPSSSNCEDSHYVVGRTGHQEESNTDLERWTRLTKFSTFRVRTEWENVKN